MSSIFETIEKFPGKAARYASPSREQLERLGTLLPEDLVRAWTENGWCSYGDGLIWTVDPDLYTDVVAQWMPAQRDLLVLARFSFGDLLMYSERAGLVKVDVLYGKILDLGARPRLYFRSSLNQASYLRDALWWDLHKQAVKKLGVLAPDEMYAFVPALPLGGSTKLEHVQKEKLLPHLNFLSQLF